MQQHAVTPRGKVLLDEASPVDSAPRPIELDPDSAEARDRADSARLSGGRP